MLSLDGCGIAKQCITLPPGPRARTCISTAAGKLLGGKVLGVTFGENQRSLTEGKSKSNKYNKKNV